MFHVSFAFLFCILLVHTHTHTHVSFCNKFLSFDGCQRMHVYTHTPVYIKQQNTKSIYIWKLKTISKFKKPLKMFHCERSKQDITVLETFFLSPSPKWNIGNIGSVSFNISIRLNCIFQMKMVPWSFFQQALILTSTVQYAFRQSHCQSFSLPQKELTV